MNPDDIIDDIDDIDDADIPPDIKLLKKKIKPQDREHYVNSKEFEALISDYYATNVISDKLAESILKIVTGLSYAPNFINYTYKSEMVGDATVKMFSALHNKKFRLNSGFSPFSYFTTIAFHAFINRIKKEKRLHEALVEYKEQVYMDTLGSQPIISGGIYLEPKSNEDDTDEVH